MLELGFKYIYNTELCPSSTTVDMKPQNSQSGLEVIAKSTLKKK